MAPTHQIGLGVGLLTAVSAVALVARQITEPRYDPLAVARSAPKVAANREATVPSMCYTRTDGQANPCWACHTVGVGENRKNDLELQKEYSFSEVALRNAWRNLFVERAEPIAAQSDEEVLRYVREDNLTPLARALALATEYPGYRPDLDFTRGFDSEGFARDGSWWRALRFKPFVGTFWPTNGSVGDVYLRLPAQFRSDAHGRPSRSVARANLSILEAAMTADPRVTNVASLSRDIEPLDEAELGVDLDGDGALGPCRRVVGLPTHYLGAAAHVPVTRGLFPLGTEFLHPVRYLDPDAPGFMATRLKELRYAYKGRFLDGAMLSDVYREELDRKERGKLPRFQGTPELGYFNDQGWVLQAFIEDATGRLRLQTHEEHLACMGCHSALGVTQDTTFSFVRKVPGSAGWRAQDLEGMPDVPQLGHAEPETLVYFRRARGGDELRANTELLERFFTPSGEVDESAVRGASDLSALLLPSRGRALALNKAYRALVTTQTFELGRDTLLAPPKNVHSSIANGATGLEAAGKVYADGSLFLDWDKRPEGLKRR